MNPEESARQKIDALLTQCGWTVQDYKALNLSASRGVALREVPLKNGRCDYLLLVDRKAIGIVEAKPEGTTLSGVADQSAYAHWKFHFHHSPSRSASWRKSSDG